MHVINDDHDMVLIMAVRIIRTLIIIVTIVITIGLTKIIIMMIIIITIIITHPPSLSH